MFTHGCRRSQYRAAQSRKSFWCSFRPSCSSFCAAAFSASLPTATSAPFLHSLLPAVSLSRVLVPASAMPYPTVVVPETGSADVLRFNADAETRASAEALLADDEVLVENKFAGLNFIDTYFRQGLYKKATPFCLGNEGAGLVVAVGAKRYD